MFSKYFILLNEQYVYLFKTINMLHFKSQWISEYKIFEVKKFRLAVKGQDLSWECSGAENMQKITFHTKWLVWSDWITFS